jgi:helicase MOV-10
MTSGKLFAVGVPDSHFTHLFVDEAGHATEADLMVALQSAPGVQHMMLAGDPKQLGAVVRAPPCMAAGMSTSPLERLMNDRSMQGQVAMLTDNYRSHRLIVRIVNVAYDDKLIPAASADPILRTPSLRVNVPFNAGFRPWNMPVSNECPVAFLHHRETEEREEDSPSWFNKAEAEMLLSVAFDLHERHGVLFSDIAIISPYRKQVGKISDLLREKLNLSKKCDIPIHVSTVEAFQGRESRVVLLLVFAISGLIMSKLTMRSALVS